MSFISELERLKDDKSGYAEIDNIALCEFLRNHADEIAELVKAASNLWNALPVEVDPYVSDAAIQLRCALANLNKEKS